MNSDAARIPSQFDPRGDSDLYQYYAQGQLRDFTLSRRAVATVIVLAVTIVYETARRRGRVPALLQCLWNGLVFIVPARLLFHIDRLINRTPVSTPMLKTQSSTHATKRDALRRILGMNKAGGIIEAVSQAGRRSFQSLSNTALGSKTPPDRPPGLGNYDNSCYQNSILQALASLKPLPEYLSTVSLERNPDLPPARTVNTLRDLIADLSSSSNNGKTLWTPRVLKSMSTWQQQDAQEYYSKLLDEIDKEIAKSARALQKAPGFDADVAGDDSCASQHSDDSGYHSLASPGLELRLPRNPLEGLIAQRVACVACGHCEGLTMIPFNCLTLNLGNLPEHDLYERLDYYTKVEAIQGVECSRCTLLNVRNGLRTLIERTGGFPAMHERLQILEEALEQEALDDEALTERCKIPKNQRVSSTKTKQAVIARSPQSLVFHMNRSVFDERTGCMFKNSAAVRFPLTLDLGPWCLGSAGGQVTPGEDGLGALDEEQWLTDPKASMAAGDRAPSKLTGPIYELRAVITHYGQHENGHYVCYRRHPVSPPATRQSGEVEEPPKLASEEEEDEEDIVDDLVSSDEEAAADGEEECSSFDDQGRWQWWRLSDQDVTRTDERTVLAQGNVFMLFYDCIDPNSVLISELDESVGEQKAFQDSRAREEMQDRDEALTDSDATLSPGDMSLPEGTVPGRDLASEAAEVPLPDDDDDE
ncbi:hypothetical protein VTK56DRAFT_8985 [Thermocarpiscus australiensis]